MDLRTRTSLLCGALAVFLAASVLLRGRNGRAQVFFAAFSLDVGLWYLAQWLYHFMHAEVWWRFTAVLAVLLPQLALHLFEAIFPRAEGRSLLLRVAGVLSVPALVLVLSPVHGTGFARGLVFTYVFGLIGAGLWSLFLRGQRSRSRMTQRRVRFVVLIGALATVFSLADFLWFVGAPLPPVGAVLCIVFLYVLAESLVRERLVDMYEMLGRSMVATAAAFTFAGIFYLFAEIIGRFQTMYLNAILAAIGMLTLFEPLREKVEGYVHRAFRERLDLERAVTRARGALSHVLQVGDMLEIVMAALEESRRATGAALYLRHPNGSDFLLSASFGPKPPARLEGAAVRPLVERLTAGPIVLESIAAEVQPRGEPGSRRPEEALIRLLAAASVLESYQGGVCLGLRSESSEPLGILVLVDARVSDAFSGEDVVLLEALALQIAIVVENSLQHRRLQERDRLAALGQMAAGLAHEVKNPLGAIKGAAQLLGDPEGGRELDPATREFVGIIVEEVDRLDRVVRSVLDYGRPAQGNPGRVDVNAAVRRTLQVLASSREQTVRLGLDIEEDLPAVRADEEQLRQVLMNLVRNAEEAQGGAGSVTVSTRRRARRTGSGYVEISVRDEGPGVPRELIEQLFVPFFTTKARGTGLGLAISQRLVQAMGGTIEVASPPPGSSRGAATATATGRGAQFTIVLPALEPGAGRPASLRPERPDPTTGAAASGNAGGAALAGPVLLVPRP